MTDLTISAADPKPWYQSTTIRAAVAIVIVQIAAALGVSLDGGVVVEVVAALGTLVGAALAVYGRVRAEQPIAPLIARPVPPRIDPAPAHDYNDD